jgi:alpha-galactosidase
MQRVVGESVGSNDGRANMGVWITPQASYLDQRTFQKHKGLYLLGGGPGAAPSTNNLLNLSDPAAQDLFFNQFETLILKYNCSRIWFDYNTDSRQSHWNLWEQQDGQGLLEMGFYRGLYNVFDRTLAKYPSVWIEGCASGGRMIDLGSLSRTMSHWSNDDSVNDDRNRRFRLGANHFRPAHYIQSEQFSPLPFSSRPIPAGRSGSLACCCFLGL